MALIKTPDGGFYVNDDEFEVNYSTNSISLTGQGGIGEAGVSSFNSRTGAVVPQDGDYTAEQVGALSISGGTLTGALNMGNNKITMGATPTATTDVTNKGYVDGVVHVVSDEVDGIIAGTTAISLPIATDTKIGGIKVGSGLKVTEDGTLNVNETSIDIPAATISTVGGVKVGSGLMVTSDGTLSNPSASTITSLPNDIYYDVQPLTRSATQNIATINAMTKQVDGGYLDSSNSGQFTFVGADQTNAGLMVASDKVKLDGIPSPIVEDNGKILTVSNGTYVLDSIGSASTSTRGVVLQAAGVTDATSADDIITQFNALLASLRTSGILQDNT